MALAADSQVGEGGATLDEGRAVMVAVAVLVLRPSKRWLTRSEMAAPLPSTLLERMELARVSVATEAVPSSILMP